MLNPSPIFLIQNPRYKYDFRESLQLLFSITSLVIRDKLYRQPLITLSWIICYDIFGGTSRIL